MNSRKKILVAEDSRTQAEMINFILEESGYEIRIASDGEQALNEMEEFDPEIVISDVIMPRMNGYELCKHIKSSRATSGIPVLLLTNLAESEDVLIGLESGADSYLMKPYNETLLLEKIEDLLNGNDSKKSYPDSKIYKFLVDKVPYELKTDRKSMLNMLLTVCESTIQDNRKLQSAQEDLAELNANLEDKVKEGTREMRDKLEQVHSMQDMLEKNRERYVRLAKNANVGIIILEQNGKIEFANGAMAEILDVRSEKMLIGKLLGNSFHSPEEFEKIIEKLNAAGKLQNEEVKIYTTKHMPRWVTLNLVLQEGHISGMVFDRTGKKFMHERDLHYREVLRNAKEKAEQLDRQKSFFIKGMDKLVKSPLNRVAGYASILAESDMEQDMVELYQNRIRSGVFDLRNKISHMLNLSKIEAGKVKPVENELPVVQKCKEVCREYSQLLKIQGNDAISINCISEGVDDQLIIITDSFLFTEVIRILIDNAVRYSEKGRINLVLQHKDEKLWVNVTDQGAGIPDSQLKEIFRQDATISKPKEKQELGLGLPVAKRLVEMLQGTLIAKSLPGEGSDFFFSIPMNEKKQDSFQENVEEMAYHISLLSGKTILVAEDLYDNYLLLTAYLEHTGARIIWVKNGDEAIKKYKSGISIDIILMDIKMPKKDGFKAIRAIRSIDKKVPIIAVTALVSSEHRSKASKLGVNAFISKPVEQEELLETLAAFFAEKNTKDNE